MKKAISIIFAAFLFLFKAYAQKDTAYCIANYTENYNGAVYGMIKHNGKYFVTATNDKGKYSKAYTDIFQTDAHITQLIPFATGIMTSSDEGMPSFCQNTMYYTGVEENFMQKDNTHSKKLKICTAINDGQTWKAAEEFPYNSPNYRTAHPAISPDGNLLVFASDMPGTIGGMDLFLCTRQGNTWSAPKNLSNLNSVKNELFPQFDNNDNLFFSSNGLPGLGRLDLYKAKRNVNGFDVPIHLNAPLNSSADDFHLYTDDDMQSGYISTNRFDPKKDGIIFFAQKKANLHSLQITVFDKYTHTPLPLILVTVKDNAGSVIHQGMTGSDGIFLLDDLHKGKYTVQGILNDITTTQAYITENDFESTPITRELLHNDPRFTLAGMAVNTQTHDPLESVQINCSNISLDKFKMHVTQSDGKFFFQLEPNSDFEIQGQKKGWLSSEMIQKSTKGLDRTTRLYVNIELKIERPSNNSTIRLRQINYDYNKAEIRFDAKRELNRIVQLMSDHPDMTIELSSHTDARGSDDYNLKLSQERAEAAVNYLVRQGISNERLFPKGYGESRLLNKCKNDTKCTEEQHAENRRTEFTILTCKSCSFLE